MLRIKSLKRRITLDPNGLYASVWKQTKDELSAMGWVLPPNAMLLPGRGSSYSYNGATGNSLLAIDPSEEGGQMHQILLRQTKANLGLQDSSRDKDISRLIARHAILHELAHFDSFHKGSANLSAMAGINERISGILIKNVDLSQAQISLAKFDTYGQISGELLTCAQETYADALAILLIKAFDADKPEGPETAEAFAKALASFRRADARQAGEISHDSSRALDRLALADAGQLAGQSFRDISAAAIQSANQSLADLLIENRAPPAAAKAIANASEAQLLACASPAPQLKEKLRARHRVLGCASPETIREAMNRATKPPANP